MGVGDGRCWGVLCGVEEKRRRFDGLGNNVFGTETWRVSYEGGDEHA